MSLFPMMLRSLRPSSRMEQHLRLMKQMENLVISSFPVHPSFEIEWKEPWYQREVKSNEPFSIRLDVKHFSPKEITVKTIDNNVIIEGKHEEENSENGQIMRHFIKTFSLPEGHEAEDVVSSLSKDGILTVTAPNKKLNKTTEREVLIETDENEIKKPEK